MLLAWLVGRADQSVHTDYETKTGKIIRITETHPLGRSLSHIQIRSEGFEHEFDETFKDVDPIKDVLIADLDLNGFDEIYIVTLAVGSGSYGNVIGIASNRDKSMSRIHFPEIETGDPIFKGYMGHDEFIIENQRLVRYFPIFFPGDANADRTSGFRRVAYCLKPGEAMWQLEIE